MTLTGVGIVIIIIRTGARLIVIYGDTGGTIIGGITIGTIIGGITIGGITIGGTTIGIIDDLLKKTRVLVLAL